MNAQKDKTEDQADREGDAAAPWWLAPLLVSLIIFLPMILLGPDVSAALAVGIFGLFLAWKLFVGLVVAIVEILAYIFRG